MNDQLVTPSQYKHQFVKEDEARLKGSQQQKVKTAFGDVNITVGGNPDGPAMVLWPSLMMQGLMWSYQYEYFGSKYRMVLIDSPGVGKSDALRRPIFLEDSSEIVINILDALGIDKCVFGGNSWGAMLAACLPAWHPERLYASMVINGTASLPTTTETIVMSIRSTVLYMNETIPKWWVDGASSAFSGDTAQATNPDFMNFLKSVYEDDPKSLHFQLQGILLGRVDRHELLRTIKDVPVLVIAGEEDRQFAVHICRKMADAIPTSKFVVFPHCAHLASRERPDLVNPEIEKFLGTVASLPKK